jgi:hypothetical protein
MVYLKHLALLAFALPALSMVIKEDGVDMSITSNNNKVTNADRMAQGLAPLAPTRRSTGMSPSMSSHPMPD